MATIRARTRASGKIHYHVQVRLKGYPAQTASFDRKTDAKRWANQIESAIRDGRHFKTAESKRHTLSDLVERYKRDILPTKKPRTRAPQVGQLEWWEEQLGSYVLADISPAILAECRDKLIRDPIKPRISDPKKAEVKRYRTPATVNRYLAVLSHAFSVAVREWEWLDNNPASRVRRQTEPRGRVRFLSESERERLMEACKASNSPVLYLVVILALSTGMRQGEILGLSWRDVDLNQGRAVLHDTKNGERRVVPITGLALDLLKSHAKLRRLDTDRLFPSHKHPTKPIDLRAPWEKALERAGIEDFRFHDLRHSAASYLAMNGASLAEIAEVLGHKTLQMVKRYAHLSEAHTAGVVGRMNEKIFGGDV